MVEHKNNSKKENIFFFISNISLSIFPVFAILYSIKKDEMSIQFLFLINMSVFFVFRILGERKGGINPVFANKKAKIMSRIALIIFLSPLFFEQYKPYIYLSSLSIPFGVFAIYIAYKKDDFITETDIIDDFEINTTNNTIDE